HDPVAARVQVRHVEPVSLEDGGNMEAVLDLEAAVPILSVEPPDLLAVEIEAGKISGRHRGIDMAAVGAGGGRGGIAFAPHEPAPAAAAPAFPECLALRADAQEHQVLAIGAGEEDALAPDGGRRAAHARQRHFPEDVLRFAPLGWEIDLLADSVIGRAAPLWPVVAPN